MFLRRQEKRLVKRLQVVWKKQMNWTIQVIEDLSIFKENSISTNNIEEEINEKISKMPYKKTFAETIVFSMRSALRKAGISIVKKFKLAEVGISFDLTNKTALRFLGGKLSHELSNYRGNIHATTVKRISAILKKSAEKGLSYQKTAQLIRQQGESGVFSQARGELIATREIGVAYEKGNQIPMQEFKNKFPEREVKKKWYSVGDERVTKPCKKNAKQPWIDFNEKFQSGDDTAPRDNHPRCRCFTGYDIPAPKK